ncbi:hypothetical protein SAMN02745164_01273 [Marinitoga hydrogenitolerans DSM 16785]|uniref:Uncharacterized protein n=1 Tax=Marinitoga hydrogenitolerans (strain DSM 16785 / JCM 12826 / AT1271) TaxID=1122195 RepID=A0A1M4WVF6_MARH1|nr:hypothetical protein [Marinitoga hydrogenitolerans]SHE85219.1 hypothetical protein SAMN02745164_01273 [Marinitoga hydrogenitolerans DSM 16785]
MRKLYYLITFILLFILSSCLKPVESKFKINVEISFSSQTKAIMNKDINEATGEIILRLDSPLANIGQAYLNIVNTKDTKDIKTIDLTSLNENTFKGTFELKESGKYEIVGIFSIGGEDYISKNKLYINVYDYKKELEPTLKFKNTKTGNVLENNIYEPYRNYSILVSIDSEIVYNSDFSYKIFFDNKLIEEGNLKNKTFESTPVFFQKKNHTISVEVLDTANNGFGRTTVTLSPKDIDTSFNLNAKIYKNSYNGIILTNNSTLTTIDPIYVVMNVNENYDLPASYLFNISDDNGNIIESSLEKTEFKYGPMYLNNGDVTLKLSVKNLITNDSTESYLFLNVEQFEEFTADLNIYKKDYLNNNIKIDDSSLITNRDPIYFKIQVNKKYDFSNDLNYSFILKKDGNDYKKLDITTNSTVLETEKMYLDEGNYELNLTITKEDTNYVKNYYRTFKVSKVVNNFNLDFSLIQKNSDESTNLYYLPEKVIVDPESTMLNDFDVNFDIKSEYSYPATYVYSIYVNNNELFRSNPVQTRNFKYTSYKFPEGHNYVKVSAKDVDSNYLVTKNFEVLVKENNPPELYRVSIEGTDVYSKENAYDFYDLEISNPLNNPRIMIEFDDKSEIVQKNDLNISITNIESNVTKTINIPLSVNQKSKFVRYSGILEGITLDSTQTWEIKIDPSQIVDEFGNTWADEFETIYYTINFKTK